MKYWDNYNYNNQIVMPGQRPNTIYVFRIIHVSNVEYLLTHGIFTKQSEQADPNYINIGDSKLIAQRNDHPG